MAAQSFQFIFVVVTAATSFTKATGYIFDVFSFNNHRDNSMEELKQLNFMNFTLEDNKKGCEKCTEKVSFCKIWGQFVLHV